MLRGVGGGGSAFPTSRKGRDRFLEQLNIENDKLL